MNLLVIGGLPQHGFFGGATVLFKDFVEYLEENNVKHTVVVTNKYVNKKTGKRKTLPNLIYLLSKFLIKIWKADVIMFNFSDHAVVSLFPYLQRISHLFHKKSVLRKFGGTLELCLQKLPESKKSRVLRSLKSADLVYIETKRGVEHLKSLIGEDANVQWFPNVRRPAPLVKDPNVKSNIIGFMAHVNAEKGVDTILSVAPSRNEYRFDIYGRIVEDKYKNFDWGRHSVNYCGEVDSSTVMKLLPTFHYLLLPSYREGYPGIIIEALSAGVPVLSTFVGGIPEIIKDGYNGKLFSAGDPEGLKNAIDTVTTEEYKNMCENALISFNENFNRETVNKKIISQIEDLNK